MDGSFFTYLLAGLAVLAITWFALPAPWARLLLGAARKLGGLRARRISVDGVDWHYLEGGDGPVLVLVHGFGGDADNWLRIAPMLTRSFRVIAPDLIGFGESAGGPGFDYAIEAQSGRLDDLLNAVGVEECILVGSSMGGWIATQLAINRPGKTRALWLIAPLGVRTCRQSELLAAIASRHASPLRISNRDEFDRLVTRRMFAKRPWIPYPLRHFYSQRAIRLSGSAETMFEQVLASSPPLEELVGHIRIPVLLQWGTLDRAVDVSGAQTLAAACPGISVRVQERVGHLPMVERPLATLRLFRDFMREIEAGQTHVSTPH